MNIRNYVNVNRIVSWSLLLACIAGLAFTRFFKEHALCGYGLDAAIIALVITDCWLTITKNTPDGYRFKISQSNLISTILSIVLCPVMWFIFTANHPFLRLSMVAVFSVIGWNSIYSSKNIIPVENKNNESGIEDQS